MIEVGSRLRPDRNVRVEQPRFPLFNADVALTKVDSPGPHALYLRPHEGDTRLYGLFNQVIVPRLAVLRDRPAAILAVCTVVAHRINYTRICALTQERRVSIIPERNMLYGELG